MTYVPLQVISAYSLLQSTLSIPKLVHRAKQLGYRSLALTDENVMYGAVEFYDTCRRNQIHPIIGLTLSMRGLIDTDRSFKIILLAHDQTGYRNLMKISTLRMTLKRGQSLKWHSSGRCQIMNLMAGVTLITPLDEEFSSLVERGQISAATQYLQTVLKQIPVRFVKIGIGIANTPTYLRLLTEVMQRTHVKPVALAPVRYLASRDAFTLQVMADIRDDRQMASPVNAERHQELGRDWLKSPDNEAHAFKAVGLGSAVRETARVAQSCHVVIQKHQTLLPLFKDQNKGSRSSKQYLHDLSRHGLRRRLAENRIPKRRVPVYTRRLRRELAVISEMGFDDYFLIVWDVINHAHAVHIMTGPGRGSAAGSLVAYALRITDVDPIHYHLLFERFLNKERAQMPDIDLDIPDDRRAEVLRYVHDKYGDAYVSQIITFDTMAAKQSLRDVGRVFKLPQASVAEWSRAIPKVPKISLADAYRQSPLLRRLFKFGTVKNPDVRTNQLLLKVAHRLEGLPRQFSTHAAGLILSDRPIVDMSPLQNGNEHLLMTQYSKSYAEGVGLLKIDFLGLRNLTLLARILKIVKARFAPRFDVRKIDLNDPATLKLFQKGLTNGVFQFESSGIKRVLRAIRPDSFGVVATVNALYRPGPIHNIATYIRRKNGQERASYPDASLKKILAPTYGIIIYQEQVMLVAQAMGGFTLGEADILRRAMSKKNHHIMARMKTKFISGARQKGFTDQVAQTTFNYMNRFASYGFNKSHAVAYSKLAFQLAYLKVHFSAAFFAALLSSVVGNRAKTQTYLSEARRLGVKLTPPDVNQRYRYYDAFRSGQFQYLAIGIGAVRNVSRGLASAINSSRRTFGPFQDLNDFVIRLYPALRQGSRFLKRQESQPMKTLLRPLIASGALDSIGSLGNQRLKRSELTSACLRIYRTVSVYFNQKSIPVTQLNRIKNQERQLSSSHPQTSGSTSASIKARRSKLKRQIRKLLTQIATKIKSDVRLDEALGLKITTDDLADPVVRQAKQKYYLNYHPVAVYAELNHALNIVPLAEIRPGETVYTMVILNQVHEIRTRNGKPMAFAQGNDETGSVDVVIFPNVYQRVHRLLSHDSLVVVIYGRIENRHGLQVVVQTIWPAANLLSDYRKRQRSERHSTFAWQQHCCYLRLDHAFLRSRNGARLHRIIAGNHGRVPVMIYNSANNSKLLLGPRYAIRDDERMKHALKSLLGVRNVVFR